MIQANELRIGNYVWDDNLVISKVIGFKPFDYSVRCDEQEGCEVLLDLYISDGSIRDGMVCESTYLSPIPLTEEWLLRFGFESNPYQDRYENKPINVECNKLNGHTELWIERMPHIKYVHQLQNLYFALTGEELTLKND